MSWFTSELFFWTDSTPAAFIRSSRGLELEAQKNPPAGGLKSCFYVFGNRMAEPDLTCAEGCSKRPRHKALLELQRHRSFVVHEYHALRFKAQQAGRLRATRGYRTPLVTSG
jgi:hypothetical protein